jgi:hypothetical protein
MRSSSEAGASRWKKLGRVFLPDGRHPCARTHASVPVGLDSEDGRVRVYFASRDERNRSHGWWLDLDLDGEATPRIVAVAEEPILVPGPLGFFDHHGVYPASLVRDGDRLLMYYIGWDPGQRRPLFTAAVGLAASEDGGRTFQKVSPAPVLGRSRHDPCFATAPCVVREGERWRIYYVSGVRWEEIGDELHSYYDIKYAESSDGIEWRRDGRVAIGLRGTERNLARPCVRRDGDGYEMWYSRAAGTGYRLGYAVSRDGLTWDRCDEQLALDGATEAWESGAQAYPWVVRIRGRRYLLYNGNGFGKDGFGIAVERAR